ncbi:MAG: glutamine-hydrolyzing carbamoyl-phosphate synthase small subunit [Clostridia bacterium]|nr:glutamine-hydrolyzing carbamoyl-phosphate synthase small subunit [Clostridia bacterium]
MAYLLLNNGAVFEGERIGAAGDSVGELVFTTGMTGYLETLTDPSYAGQIIVQTFPLIGNYGVIEEDFEGEPAAAGYVVREICSEPSNFRSGYALDEFLKRKNIPGICGVDTRELTRILRDEGVMNAAICDVLPSETSFIGKYRVENAVGRVSGKKAETYLPEGEAKYSVALIDYGAKKNIVRSLLRRGCKVTVVPYDTPAEAILERDPDGIMLSNGPGDPAENVYCIEQIKKLIGRKPVFGICLGHQLAALAMGGRTVKLKFGHRGVNQPVKELGTDRTYITSQNHGYAVVTESLGDTARLSFVNMNDGSCEGLEYKDKDCFTVQFHPEACAGPNDTAFLFDRFISMMGGKKLAEG